MKHPHSLWDKSILINKSCDEWHFKLKTGIPVSGQLLRKSIPSPKL